MYRCLIQFRKFYGERSAEYRVKCGIDVFGDGFVQGNYRASIFVGKPAGRTKIAAVN